MANPLHGVYASVEDAQKNGYTPAQLFALAAAGGSGRRVWFAEPRSAEKERWLLDARAAWLSEIARSALAPNSVPQGERLVSVIQEAKSPRPQSELARRFVELFGANQTAARELSSLAAGCDLQESAGALSHSNLISDVLPLARKASLEEAWACAAREKKQRAWNPVGAPLDPADSTIASWEDVERQARLTITERNLRYLAVDGEMSPIEALAAARDLNAGLGLIERETGLGLGSSGLSSGPGAGWGVELGGATGASGMCYAGHRKIELALNGGDGALAHEWFHALDGELEALDAKAGAPRGMASEGAKLEEKGGYASLLSKLVETLTAPGERKAAGGGSPEEKLEKLAGDYLLGSGTRSSLGEREQESFDKRWRESVWDFLNASPGAAEASALEGLATVYTQANPALQKDDFIGLFAGLREAKSPSKQALLLMNSVDERSDFYINALLGDLSEKKNYLAQKCEMLARAFETSFALDAGREATGVAGALSMISSTEDGSNHAPAGAERDRARQAFINFFKELRERLAADPNAPAWGKREALEPGEIRFAERLAARRGDGGLPKRSAPSAF